MPLDVVLESVQFTKLNVVFDWKFVRLASVLPLVLTMLIFWKVKLHAEPILLILIFDPLALVQVLLVLSDVISTVFARPFGIAQSSEILLEITIVSPLTAAAFKAASTVLYVQPVGWQTVKMFANMETGSKIIDCAIKAIRNFIKNFLFTLSSP
jgi:hypothetical protein